MLSVQLSYLLAKAFIAALGFGFAGYVSLLLLLALLRKTSSAVKYHLSNIMLLLNFLVFLFPFSNLLRSSSAQLPGGAVVQSSDGVNTLAITLADSKTTAAGASDMIQWLSFRLLAYRDVLAVLYTAGLAIFLLQLLYSYFRALHFKKNGTSTASDEWVQRLASAMAKLNVTKRIRIAFSSLVSSPCIIGHSKAIILIPLALVSQLTPDQAEAILLHELAHFRQYDHYINVAGRIVCCILFFNPFAWLFLRISKTYREYACDEVVASHGKGVALAESIVQISSLRTTTAASLSLGLAHQKNHLFNRIQNLLSMKKKPRSGMYVFGIPALTAIVLLSCAVLSFYGARAGKTKDLTALQQLAATSNKMFDEGNDNYILADALHDSLLQLHQPFSYTYASGQVTINGKQLPGKLGAAYARKMEGFLTLFGYGGEHKLSNKGKYLDLETLMRDKGAFSTPEDLGNKLAALSERLYDEKNVNFILVDALNDKLILVGQSFHFIYTAGDITIDGHALSADITKKYVDKLKAFYHDHGGEASFWSVNSGGMTYETLFNPNNSFHRTDRSRTETEPVSRKVQQDLLMGELAKDQIADTAKGFSLMYNVHGIFVNNKKLVGRMEKKYLVLCFNAFGHVPTNENESSSLYTGNASPTPTGIKTGIGEIDFKK